jgi:hypothetical protein
MFDWYKWDIIEKLKKSNRAVIGLGDSFTQGAGACSLKLWEQCNWNVRNIKTEETWEYEIEYYKNSWVNQLCKNHLIGWTPINFGMIGKGNRAAVKELYLHPELDLKKIDEKIVVFMLSGMERFDFVHKKFFEHVHFDTIWPAVSNDIKEKNLWESYGKYVYTDRVAIIELLLTIAELKTWCELNNAKLVLISAFRPEYQRDYFIDKIQNGEDDEKNYIHDKLDYIESIVDIIDWNEFVRPGGYNCVSDFLCGLEEREDLLLNETEAKYYQYAYSLEKLSPKGYITNCAHPSIKGHIAIAEKLFEHLITYHKDILKNRKLNGKKILTNII